MADSIDFRQASSVIEISRDLMAVLCPATGTRGTGKAFIKPRGSDPVILQRNWPLIPIINGAAREELIFKVGQGPNRAKFPNGKRVKADPNEPDTESWWTIQPGGTLVDIVSVIGGKRHNLKKGTKLIFDPINLDLEVEVDLFDDIKNSSDPIHFGGCKSLVQFEQLDGPQATLDAFRAQVGAMPAAIVVWDGSEPADGTTQSSTNRGSTRIGQGSQLFKERYNIFVISERLDSGPTRRSEGLKLMDDLTFLLTDRQEVDGQIFSAPTGIQIRGRGRVAGDNAQYQAVYIYVISLSVTSQWKGYDSRTFTDWLLAHNEILTFAKDDEGGRKVVVNQDIDMTTD